MLLDENIVSTLAIAFFIICISLIIRLSFFVSNNDVKKKIYTFSLRCGFFFSAIETIKYKIEISPSRAIGGILGFVAGFYCSYLICILAGISDGISLMESSGITVAICFGCAEANRQIGSFFGNVFCLHNIINYSI
jgi:hypothetical protein